ncbi:protein kinase [Streptomyces sp. NPDC060194]|uniref:Stk1 family PASTA domain-containing Ser/Thr kinase n=1 Tax=Streptomyces sp. NPDC060194 TaxID=3347069 RepID=UPI00364B1753
MSQDGGFTGRSLAGGRYRLLDLLGTGGMASVHLAHDRVLDRQVAIKTLHSELGREAAFRERFRREAQAVAKLSHPNIVTVFDTGESALDDDGGAPMPYIVMEYVEGQPLGSVLDADVRRQGAMPADKALRITADVLAALEISHEVGLVHRDIKPGNVMMTRRDVVKVMDFGIARAMQSGVTSMTQTGMVVGTPQYLSPEQALGRGVDARSDLYSVGIMLFQLVTGRLPFDADSPLAIAYAHVQEAPVAPSSVNQALPPAVDALVARALRKNPNERFPTAEAMRDECLRVAASLQPAAPHIIAGPSPQAGAGIGSTVFPPIDQHTPPPSGPVQTPYQPGPYGAPTPQPAHLQQHQGYGYPQQGGYPTAPQQGYGQTQPYNLSPQHPGPSSGGGKRNVPLIVTAAVVALAAIGGLVAYLSNGDEGKRAGGDAKPSASATKNGYKGPDTSKTIDAEKCTDARESFDDETKLQMPNFQYSYIDSVQDCIQAARWSKKVLPMPDNIFGKGAVMKQVPAAGEDFDPEDTITLYVSTGYPN